MRRIGTAALATVGLAAIFVVGGSLAPASAEPTPSASGSSATGTATATAVATPEASSTAEAVPPTSAASNAGASGSQAVTSRRRDGAIKTLDDLRAGVTVFPGDTGPAVVKIQRLLNVAGIKTPETGTYSNETTQSVAHLQWKYLLDETGNLDRSTYRQLLKITKGRATLPRDCRNPKTRIIICIDLTQRNLRYVKNGKVTWTIDIRSGRASEPTRKGLWHVFSKQVHLISTLYGSPMPYSMFFSGGQAMHYSMYFDAAGYNGASHGCVNIGSRAQAKWLFTHTPMGTPVRVY